LAEGELGTQRDGGGGRLEEVAADLRAPVLKAGAEPPGRSTVPEKLWPRGGRITMLKTKLAGRSLWLITKHTTNGMDIFTTNLSGDSKVLVVFSFEEEAEMFLDLRLAASEDGWKVRQTSRGELVSILYGPCSGTKKVVLDPVPEIGGEALADLLSMPRNDFLRTLLGEEEASNLHLVPSDSHRPQDRATHGHVA
jgi:hypothetical protein